MKKNNKKKVVIFGSTKGIGKSIYDTFDSDNNFETIGLSSKTFDTSSIEDLSDNIKKIKSTDILVLNTGGPPNIPFNEIKLEDWEKYHKQLFLSFAIILQKLNLKKGGFIFLISSGNIKEPSKDLILSSVYRIALVSLLKSYSKIFSYKHISTINIMPLAIKTNRIKNLVGKNMKNYEKSLPFKKLGKPNDISNFIYHIVKSNIKYLNGVSISIDGGISNNIF